MKKILTYVSITLALLYVIRELEYVGIRKNKSGEFGKLRVAFEEKNNFDFLFIGSSRAECQFYPPIIDSMLHVHSFNLGMTGATMPLIRTSLEAYLVHSQAPKYIVLNLDLHSFSDNPDTVHKFPRYFPYLDNEKLMSGIRQRDTRFVFFKWLPFYSMPYFNTNYLNASLRGWFDKPGLYDAGYANGFAPSMPDSSYKNVVTQEIPYRYSIPAHYVWESLDSIVNICSKNNIQLSLVVTPLFHRKEERILNYNGLVFQFEQYARQHRLNFLNLGHDPIRENPDCYTDLAHLNQKGALLFSRTFSLAFMQYLPQ